MNSQKKIFVLILGVFLLLSSQSYGQYSATTKMITQLHQSVRVDVESGLFILFADSEVGKRFIRTSDIYQRQDSGKAAAIVRVTGGSAELMVDIEKETMEKNNEEGGPQVLLYDFNIAEEGAGSSVSVMPFASDDSFVLSIGGTVEGGSEDTFYEAVNLLNINFL